MRSSVRPATRAVARAAATAAAALLAVTAPLPAYILNVTSSGIEVGWDLAGSAPNVIGGKVTYYVDASGSTDIPPAEFAAAVRAGVAAWEQIPGVSLAFLEDPTRPAAKKSGSDRVNRLAFTAGELSPFVYAVAFRTYNREKLVDADVVFNPDVRVNDGSNGGAGTPLPWTTATPGQVNTSDVQAVTVHEWGHCLGFDHVPNGRASMFFALPAGAIMTRSPDPDDEAGTRHRYPGSTFPVAYGALEGTVDIAGTTNERGVQVTAIDYATARPAASAFSWPDGKWRIEGLPPGVYRLVASPILTSKAAGNVYNPFWKNSVTDLVPVADTDGSGLFLPRFVEAGATTEIPAFALSPPLSAPGEPDDTVAQARPIAIGGAAFGRIEATEDDDVFSLAGTAGTRVSIYVDAFHLGSDLDPRVTLFSPLGIMLRDNRDIRTGPDSFDAEGFDLDARILDYTLPLTGTYTIVVRSDVVLAPDALPEDQFYVLTVLPAGGAPHAATSTLVAAPDVLDADGASTSEIVFRPRTLTGASAGPGLSVAMTLAGDDDPDGSLSMVMDRGDGSYAATLTAAADAGSDTVRATVDGTLVSTVGVAYRGPASAARSDFAVSPPRMRPGGDPASLHLVPRDVNGVPHGAGRTVTFEVGGATGSSAGAAADGGDGSYAATLTPGGTRGAVPLDATVDGVPLGSDLVAGVGFPLGEVVAEVLARVQAAIGAGPPVKSASKLEAARTALVAASDAATAGDVLKNLRKAARSLEAAAKKGAATAVDLYLLGETSRETAADARTAAEPHADLPPEQKALAKATALFAKAETLLATPRTSAAIAKYRASLLQAGRVVP